ncbi:MAG: hypothetical protein BWY68_00532 [bacterium ADurb.Bin400]|nr:MAG: hypothetical protein BWY68_00532 [bacterium ADurb.Bin400]
MRLHFQARMIRRLPNVFTGTIMLGGDVEKEQEFSFELRQPFDPGVHIEVKRGNEVFATVDGELQNVDLDKVYTSEQMALLQPFTGMMLVLVREIEAAAERIGKFLPVEDLTGVIRRLGGDGYYEVNKAFEYSPHDSKDIEIIRALCAA